MTDGIDPEPNYDTGRNIWKQLDLLLSFAEAQTSTANHNNPNSLLGVLGYLRELEAQVQRELDFTVIALKEFWRYSSRDIARALGSRWEHDHSHLPIELPGNELNIGWPVAQKRYRDALKRQFGSDIEIPSLEYFELSREEVAWRRKVINPDGAPLPLKPENDRARE